jgi:hypothetical protein
MTEEIQPRCDYTPVDCLFADMCRVLHASPGQSMCLVSRQIGAISAAPGQFMLCFPARLRSASHPKAVDV